ncbi:MAG: alpha/beta fold hydrolase [Phycisphaerales bacterium]|nr:alpha/beta fold hydrolase [Phycisphaerales bacterium]MCB9856010.1 alpha/beta fold hydrolase [Phycisphaerales bacterium]
MRLADGYEIRLRWWAAAGDAPKRGVVLYFHGIQSHGGWYEASGAALSAAGFDVCMPDRRGSGLNAAPRGHCVSVEQTASDAEALLRYACEASEFNAAHLFGVSWGGKQGVWLAQAMPDRVASITLACPGLFPKVDLTTTDKFRVAMAMVNDRDKLFDIPLNSASYFTDNPERIRFVDEDPIKLTQVSASFLLASRQLDKRLRKFDRSSYRGPVHLMLAGKERVIDNARTRAWFDALPSEMKRLSEFPEASHTIEFEQDPSAFLEAVVGFVTDCV